MTEINLKEELAGQASRITEPPQKKTMTIPDMIKAMAPEIKKALPSVITPERFTRIALSATSNNPELTQCTPISFLSALLNAAQLGLEPNTPLGQAYLIPYKNKEKLECQFQIGYKGMIDLAYRNGDMQTIQAHTVYENDEFDFSYGLNGTLVHKPAKENRGEPVYFYGFFKTTNGGYSYSVMSRANMDEYAKTYSKAFGSGFSPWKTSYEAMAKKTVLKQALKYAPIKTDLARSLSTDMTIKNSISEDMREVANEIVMEGDDE